TAKAVEAQAAHDLLVSNHQQVRGIAVVVLVDITAVGPSQRLPVHALDKDPMAKAVVLLELAGIERGIERRHHMHVHGRNPLRTPRKLTASRRDKLPVKFYRGIRL